MSRAVIRAGFTLIEVLAVLFLTALVIGIALDFYIDLSNQSARASDLTREIRRATSLLDRVARDFERTVLVRKPGETDPLAHPWVFLAESRHAEDGADRVKFVTRNPADGRGQVHQGDITLVTYALEPAEDGEDFTLLRSSSPSLPESLDREFPFPDDPGVLQLADGVQLFSLKFLDETGEWLGDWDSSQLLDSGELPLAVEIEVALSSDAVVAEAFDEEPLRYSRRVMLPVRPLDMETLLDPEAAEGGDGSGEDEEGGPTVAECVDPTGFATADSGAEGVGNLQGVDRVDIEGLMGRPFSEIADLYCGHPAVLPECCN